MGFSGCRPMQRAWQRAGKRCDMVRFATAFSGCMPSVSGLARGFATVPTATAVPVGGGAWPRCLARPQFRLQASATGLARGAATVRLGTTVPVSGLCIGPGKDGASRDYSSVCRPSVAGLARGFATVPTATAVPIGGVCCGPGKGRGHGATRDYNSDFRPLLRAWQGAWPLCDSQPQFRFQAAGTGLANRDNNYGEERRTYGFP